MATPPYASPLEDPKPFGGGGFQPMGGEKPPQAYAPARTAHPPSAVSPMQAGAAAADQKAFANSLGAVNGDESVSQRVLRLEEDVLALSLSAANGAANAPGARRASGDEAGSQVDRLADRVDRISGRLDTLMLQVTEERALRQQDLVDTNTRFLAIESRRDGEASTAQVSLLVRREVEHAVAQLQRSSLQPHHRNDDLEQRIISLAVAEACKSLHGESDFWRREVMRLDAEVVQGRGRIESVEATVEEFVKAASSGRSLPGTTATLAPGGLDTDRAPIRLLDGAVSTLKASVEEIKASNRRTADELGRRIDDVQSGLRSELRSGLRDAEFSGDNNSELLALSESMRRQETQHAEFRQHLDDIWARIASERMERHERHNALTCKMENGLQRLIQKLDKSQDPEPAGDAVAPPGPSPSMSPLAEQRFITSPPTQVRPPSVKRSPAPSPSRGSPPMPTRTTIPLAGGFTVASQVAEPTSLRASTGTPLAMARSTLVGVRSLPSIGLGAGEAPPPSMAPPAQGPVTIVQTPQQAHRPVGSPLWVVDRNSLRVSASPPGRAGAKGGHRVGSQGRFLAGTASPPAVATPATQSRGSLSMAPPPISASPPPPGAPPGSAACRAAALAAASAAAVHAVSQAGTTGGSRAASPVALTRGPYHAHSMVQGSAGIAAAGTTPGSLSNAGSSVTSPGGAVSPLVGVPLRAFSTPPVAVVAASDA